MKKILVVGPILDSGGVTRFVKDLLNSKLGYHLFVFDTAKPVKIYTSKGPLGYRTLIAAGIGRAVKNGCIFLKNIIKYPIFLIRNRPNLIHIASSSYWNFFENSFYLMWSKMFNVPTIFHFLGDFHLFYQDSNRFMRRFIMTILKWSNKIFVLSEGVKNIIAQKISKNKIYVIPSSVDTYLFHPNNDEASNYEKKIRILFLGSVSGIRKGVMTLINVIPKLISENNDLEFILCGSGDVELAYNNIKLQVNNNQVKYLKSVTSEELPKLLSKADIYVLPSYSEGLPYSIMEAMSCGLPIISTDVGCIPEIVKDGENGKLIKPGDVDALYNSIKELIQNRALMSEIKNNNRRKICEHYSWKNTLKIIENIYQEVIR